MRWASMALATSLDSSEDQELISRIRDAGTQVEYRLVSMFAARRPAGVPEDPMRTRSGLTRLSMAEPSDRNSGLDRTSKGTAGRRAANYSEVSILASGSMTDS